MLVFPLFVWILIAGIIGRVGALIGIGAMILIFSGVGIGFYLNYGITITPKRICLVYIDTLKFFDFNEVTRITIYFSENWICGEIKQKNMPVYTFDFDEFSLSRSSLIFSSLCDVKVAVKEKKVERFIEKSSWSDKIHIVNQIGKNCDKNKITHKCNKD